MAKSSAPPNVLLVQIIGVYPVGFERWYLIEVILSGVSGRVDFGLFGQPDPEVSPDRWQAAYDERLLSPDGTSEGAMIGYGDAKDVWHGTMRCTFFFFDVHPDEPFVGPTGEIRLPPISDMPDRLKFIEFIPPD